MSAEAEFIPGRRGLKPGMIHSGSFRKGDDPRRYVDHVRYEGLTIAQIARQKGPRAIELLWQNGNT